MCRFFCTPEWKTRAPQRAACYTTYTNNEVPGNGISGKLLALARPVGGILPKTRLRRQLASLTRC